MRGKDSNTDAYTGNALWGMTDLKVAVRYLRYNAVTLNDITLTDPDGATLILEQSAEGSYAAGRAGHVGRSITTSLDNFLAVVTPDFATVWGQGHTMAERTGDATANFIAWIKEKS